MGTLEDIERVEKGFVPTANRVAGFWVLGFISTTIFILYVFSLYTTLVYPQFFGFKLNLLVQEWWQHLLGWTVGVLGFSMLYWTKITVDTYVDDGLFIQLGNLGRMPIKTHTPKGYVTLIYESVKLELKRIVTYAVYKIGGVVSLPGYDGGKEDGYAACMTKLVEIIKDPTTGKDVATILYQPMENGEEPGPIRGDTLWVDQEFFPYAQYSSETGKPIVPADIIKVCRTTDTKDYRKTSPIYISEGWYEERSIVTQPRYSQMYVVNNHQAEEIAIYEAAIHDLRLRLGRMGQIEFGARRPPDTGSTD